MSTVRCPHCSRPYPRYEGVWRGWSVDLTTNLVSGPRGLRVSLTRQEAEILAILLAARGEVVGLERMFVALWGSRPPTNPYDAVRSRVVELRQQLKPNDSLVRTVRGVGYAADAQEPPTRSKQYDPHRQS